MAFIEAEFPKTISAKAMGGPGFNTTVNEGFSGFEQRNQNWAVARGEWNVSLTTPSPNFVANPQLYIDQLTAFFLNIGGKANGFRLKDHKDFTNGASAASIGVGDGSTSIFQLQKGYSSAGRTYTRAIYKPMTSLVVDYLGAFLADSVAVFIGGVTQSFLAGYVDSITAHKYTLDETLGTVCFRGYSKWTLTAVTVDGLIATYTYAVVSGNAPQKNQIPVITGMTHSQNSGATFLILSVTPTSPTAGTFTVSNGTALAESGSTGTGILSASKVAITAAANVTGSTWRYTYTLTSGDALAVGMRITISGMNTGNNKVLYITSFAGGAGTFDAVNATGFAESGASGVGYTDWTPVANAVLTATFQFHFPVRFDTDKLAIQLEESDVKGGEPIISWNAIILRELRLSAGQG